LWQRYRRLLASRFTHPDGVIVIDDLVIAKQGRQSVGVHRQFCPALGRKINCQVAVAIYFVGSGVCFPLAIRLYLPVRWLRTESHLDAAGVPREYRQYRSRAQIALELLDELRGEQPAYRCAVLGLGYGTHPELRRSLTRPGHLVLAAVPPDFVVLQDPTFDSTRQPLSVEGVQPVTIERLAASAGHGRHSKRSESKQSLLRIRIRPQFADAEELDLLITIQEGATTQYAVGGVADLDSSQVFRIWNSRARVDREQSRLKDECGLDHFEGRSWRGFHHHACLVALAHGFRLTSAKSGDDVMIERNGDFYCI
jgi:SRSO17 transposase